MSAPTALPRPRPSWREPRFLLGLVLVIASVAGVAGLVVASDRTVEVFAARHALAAGDELSSADLVGVRVRLGAAQASYLRSAPEADTVVTRTIAAGELVPVGALGAASAQRQTSVMIALDGELPESIAVGTGVEIWAAAAAAQAGAGGPRFASPQTLVPDATVVRVVRDSGLGASGGVAVEVRVPKDATAGLLEAIANGSAITLVPAGD